MDYDVVRSSIAAAYKNYGKNDNNFYSSMDKFYSEGSKNPSVAKIMLNDYIFNKQRDVSKMLNVVSSFPVADTPGLMSPEILEMQKNIYSSTVNAAMKSISAQDIYKNTSALDNSDSNIQLGMQSSKKFNEEWRKRYPKTGKTRERIINANRVSMTRVTPKADWYEKINFVKTIGEYKKDYPKTFYARYALIMNSQIEEEKVTPKVKNWFKRFTYKRLIKEGFSFKK